MTRNDAEALGLEALAWLGQHDDLLGVFIGSTGATPGDLRAAARDPAMLAAVLDFLCMDDDWIAAFTSELSYPPDAPARARAALPGGDVPHWT